MAEETGNLKDGGMGGQLPETPAKLHPIETVDENPNTGPTPFDDMPKDELNRMAKEAGVDTSGETPPAEIEPPPEKPPETSPEEEYDSEAEWIKDLGIAFDKEYDNIRDLVMDLHRGKKELEGRYGEEHPLVDKIQTMAKTLNTTPENVIEALSNSLDPRRSAGQPEKMFENFENLISQTQFEEPQAADFYRKIAGALSADIISQMESRFGRLLNKYDSDIDEMRLDYRLDKVLSEPKHESWKNRRNEIRSLLLDPAHSSKRGKSDAIEWAMRFISAGEKPASVEEKARKLSKEQIQAIEERKRKYYSEGPGRSPVAGKLPSDVRDFTREQLEAELKRLDRENVSPVG
jgi:hypothetical protein